MATANVPEAVGDHPRLPFPLQPGEQVLGFKRRHWLYLYPRLIGFIVATLALPVPAAWLLTRFDLPSPVIIGGWAIAAAWLLYWGFRAVLLKYRYDNDIWVITNQRLIDSSKRHWFDLRVSTADLVDVEDTSIHRSGVLRTLFDYGDIQCQTAGAVQNFALRGIPKPREFHALVDRVRDQARATREP